MEFTPIPQLYDLFLGFSIILLAVALVIRAIAGEKKGNGHAKR